MLNNTNKKTNNKWLLLVMAIAFLVASCDKDTHDYRDPNSKDYDPKRVEIENLEAEIKLLVLDSIKYLEQGRVAFVDGRTKPQEITNNLLEGSDQILTSESNFLDTLDYIILRYEKVCKDAAVFGLPAPNKENMDKYFNVGEKLRTVVNQLKPKRNRLVQLKSGKSTIAKSETVNIHNKVVFDNVKTKNMFANSNKVRNTRNAHFARSNLNVWRA